MALAVCLHALAEGLLGTGREQHYAHSRWWVSTQATSEGQQDSHGREVVVGPRYDGAEPDVGHRGDRTRGQHAAGSQRAAAAEQRARTHDHGAKPDAVEDRQRVRRTLVQPGQEPWPEPGERGVEDESAVRSIVMGDEHDGPRCGAVASLRHHVPCWALGKQGSAKPATPVAEIVPQRRGGSAREERREQPRKAATTPPGRDRTHECEYVAEAQRPPVAAMCALLLDGSLAAERAQMSGDQARCVMLALGSRRPREGGQLADRRAPRLSIEASCICLPVR